MITHGSILIQLASHTIHVVLDSILALYMTDKGVLSADERGPRGVRAGFCGVACRCASQCGVNRYGGKKGGCNSGRGSGLGAHTQRAGTCSDPTSSDTFFSPLCCRYSAIPVLIFLQTMGS